MTQRERALLPDYLRLIALFGIVIVNVQFIAFSVFEEFDPTLSGSVADIMTLWAVNALAMLRTYGLFSFMFGVGLGFLMRSAARRSLPFGRIYRNRMIGLGLLGVAHGCLFFPGDILTTYAVTGAILYLFRDWPVGRLVRVGAALLVLQTILALPLMLIPSEPIDDFIAIEQATLSAGTLVETIIYRSMGFAITFPFILFAQGIAALGWFCLGLAAVKSGMIDNAAHPLWRRARRLCLLPGVSLSIIGEGLWLWGGAWPGALLSLMVAPIATLGYLGLIALIARPPGPILARALAAGGSSLSVYLGQSIVLSTVFSAYGLGLWNAVDRFSATAIAVLVTIVLIAFVSLWRTRFVLGPFEWVLRRITYAGVRAP
ncbi:MAG: DUF418 domain-containing protein [Pseudomonadota bacterium]